MDWLKKFGPAQNILGPVKGQGINVSKRANVSKTHDYFSAGSVAYIPPVWLVFEQDGDKVKVL